MPPLRACGCRQRLAAPHCWQQMSSSSGLLCSQSRQVQFWRVLSCHGLGRAGTCGRRMGILGGRKSVSLALPFRREVEPSPNGHKVLAVINRTPLCSGKRPKPVAIPCCGCDRGPSSPSVERESPFRAAMRRCVVEEHRARVDTCFSVGLGGTEFADGPPHYASATILRSVAGRIRTSRRRPRAAPVPTTGTGSPVPGPRGSPGHRRGPDRPRDAPGRPLPRTLE